MAAQWADIPSGDLGLYDDDETKMLDGIWAQIVNSNLIYDPDPSVGTTGRCVQLGGNNFGTGAIRKVYSGTRSAAGMACRIWINNLPAGNALRPGPFSFRDSDNNTLVY